MFLSTTCRRLLPEEQLLLISSDVGLQGAHVHSWTHLCSSVLQALAGMAWSVTYYEGSPG